MAIRFVNMYISHILLRPLKAENEERKERQQRVHERGRKSALGAKTK
jgi:hypothetical protein